jgi:hypothetical protein
MRCMLPIPITVTAYRNGFTPTFIDSDTSCRELMPKCDLEATTSGDCAVTVSFRINSPGSLNFRPVCLLGPPHTPARESKHIWLHPRCLPPKSLLVLPRSGCFSSPIAL